MTIQQFREWWKAREIAKADEAYKDHPPHWQSCRAATIACGIEYGEKFWRKHRAVLKPTTLEEWIAWVAKKDILKQKGGEN